MIERLRKVLKELPKISAYLIGAKEVSAEELFLVREEADMLRSKDVREAELTVYVDFEEDGKKYRGSSSINVYPSMTEEELKEAASGAAYAAGFVKNEWYPLAPAYGESFEDFRSGFAEGKLRDHILDVREVLYGEKADGASLNSAEIFIERWERRLVNSEGLDVSFHQYKGMTEFITDSEEGREPVEIYCLSKFADLDRAQLSESVSRKLSEAAERATAVPTKKTKGINVFLTGGDVAEFFSFYYAQSAAQMAYQKMSSAKLGEDFMKEATGDRVTMTLRPLLPNSTDSAPFDNDGVKLADVVVFDKGVMKTWHGPLRFTSYLGASTTGSIRNYEIALGSRSLSELKKEPYIEILAFSDMSMDHLTGDFGGEIRLARHFDGEKITVVSGGSFTANAFEVQKTMMLSAEVEQNNSFKGPKAVMFRNVEVLGE